MAQLQRYHKASKQKLPLERRKPIMLICLALLVGVTLVVGLLSVLQGSELEVIPQDVSELVTSEKDAAQHKQADKDVQDSSTQNNNQETDKMRNSVLVVHVDGAVVNPGVYEISQVNARIRDAINAAGGLSADAQTQGINFAELIQDAQKIYIPRVGEEPQAQGAGAAQNSSSLGAGTRGSLGTGLVNLNTATLEELQTLPGVGAATAQRIVDDRAKNGKFTSIEDLMRISGIGEKKFEKLRDKICV